MPPRARTAATVSPSSSVTQSHSRLPRPVRTRNALWPMALTSPRFANAARLQQASENNPPLKAPETSEAVRILQLALLDLGFAMPISTAGGTALPDGIFGPETTQTVRAFQRANGLD